MTTMTNDSYAKMLFESVFTFAGTEKPAPLEIRLRPGRIPVTIGRGRDGDRIAFTLPNGFGEERDGSVAVIYESRYSDILAKWLPDDQAAQAWIEDMVDVPILGAPLFTDELVVDRYRTLMPGESPTDRYDFNNMMWAALREFAKKRGFQFSDGWIKFQ